MHTPSPLSPRGSPVPGVIPEPVRDDVPAGVHRAGRLDATSGPGNPPAESMTKEG